MTEDEALTAAVLQAVSDVAPRKQLPCAAAFALAGQHGVDIGRIGEICNANGIRIVQCQLGCF